MTPEPAEEQVWEDPVEVLDSLICSIMEWWDAHEIEHIEDEDGTPEFVTKALKYMAGSGTDH